MLFSRLALPLAAAALSATCLALGFLLGVQFNNTPRLQGRSYFKAHEVDPDIAQSSPAFPELSNRSPPSSSKNLNKTTNLQSRAETLYAKFLVISSQRSGSGLLVSLINDHSRIRCGGEEVHKDSKKNLSLDAYVEQLQNAWDRMFGEPLPKPPTIVGFKVMYNRGIVHHNSDLVAELGRMGVKVIHLVRKNKLLQYISDAANIEDKRARPKNHIPHPRTNEDASRLREILVDAKPEKVLEFMRLRERMDEEVSRLLSENLSTESYLLITYEDLSLNATQEMARVFNFLGSGFEHVSTNFTKIHEAKRTRDYIKEDDRNELEKALNDTREFAWTLDGW